MGYRMVTCSTRSANRDHRKNVDMMSLMVIGFCVRRLSLHSKHSVVLVLASMCIIDLCPILPAGTRDIWGEGAICDAFGEGT